MRVFSSAVELMSETCREVFSRGHIAFDPTVQGKIVKRDEYEMKELLAYTFTLTEAGHKNKDDMLKWARENFQKDHLVPEYASKWVEAMFTNTPGEEIQAHRKFYPKYWDEFGGNFPYTYAERCWSSIAAGRRLLQKNKYRRGIVITVYHPYDLLQAEHNVRVPCSLAYHPLIRRQGLKDKLYLSYLMRSCDLTNWFPLDTYRAMLVQECLADELQVELGSLFGFVSSLHCYKVDVPERLRW